MDNLQDMQHKTRGRECRQGDHICAAYQSPAEQLAVAVHYVGQGLKRREQCIYAADSVDALDAFRTALMCQYDVSRLPHGLLNHALETHPSIVVDGCHKPNTYFDIAALTRTDAERGEFATRLATLRAQVA